MLFVADFNPIGNGCHVVAVDLTNGKQVWEAKLSPIVVWRHIGFYENQVNIDARDDVVIVHGKESYCRYVEILDIETGKTVGHKVYRNSD